MSARLIVQVSSAPITRGPRMLAKVRIQITAGGREHARRRFADPRDELRQVANRGHRDRNVSDPVAEPVDVVGLKPHVGPEKVPRVGVGPAFLRVQLSELGEDQAQRGGARGRDDPAEDGDAAHGGEADGKQEDARADHVAGHQHRGLQQRHLLRGIAHADASARAGPVAHDPCIVRRAPRRHPPASTRTHDGFLRR